jgi:predicted nucleic acid-binding protein
MSAEHARGLIDTNIVILRKWIPEGTLPAEIAISTVTLGEMAASPHYVVGDDPEARGERARRVDALQRVEDEFEPLRYDVEAARAFGRISAAVLAIGRKPRGRVADLQIAAVAAANQLPLYTTNPDDYAGLDDIVQIVAVQRPAGDS